MTIGASYSTSIKEIKQMGGSRGKLPTPRYSPRRPQAGLEPVQNPRIFTFYVFFSSIPSKLKQIGESTPYIGYQNIYGG
jgi:hypothetical protein